MPEERKVPEPGALRRPSARYTLKDPIKVGDVVEVEIKLNGALVDTVKYTEKIQASKGMEPRFNVMCMIRETPPVPEGSPSDVGKVISTPEFTKE